MEYLAHYGVKGMKWGVRHDHRSPVKRTKGQKWGMRYSGDRYVIDKGTTVKRVATTREDPIYDNKKYVSVNDEDHKKWEDYIGTRYLNNGRETYSVTYKTTNDIQIASSETQGKIYTDMLLNDPDFANQAVRDTLHVNMAFRLPSTKDQAENISRNIALQTNTGKKFVEKVMSMGYEGVFDTHGTNVSELPVIIFNPDRNLNRLDVDLTSPVKEYNERRRAALAEPFDFHL